MSDSVKWSFSADRCRRRCERLYFLQHVAAWHNARDPVRKESFLLKQGKTLELWTGSLVHRGIELFVVPALQANRSIPWQRVIDATLAIANRQFEFSKGRRYREEKMSKAKAGDDYCALLGHETEEGVPPAEFERVRGTIEDTFRMSKLCWPVPDRCIRLSIDLKLCDDYLRSVAGAADDDEGLFGEDDDGAMGFDMRAAAGWGG